MSSLYRRRRGSGVVLYSNEPASFCQASAADSAICTVRRPHPPDERRKIAENGTSSAKMYPPGQKGAHPAAGAAFSRTKHPAAGKSPGIVPVALVLFLKIVYNSQLTMRNGTFSVGVPPGDRPMERKNALMIQLNSEQGAVTISSAVFSNITGIAATNCFGVKGMAYRSMTDGLVHLLRREAMSKGVSVTANDDGTVSIELHIIVENGVNLPAVCSSIMNEVRYMVTKNTGVEVKAVDVCVDSMTL